MTIQFGRSESRQEFRNNDGAESLGDFRYDT
jgi:hypothetical protein